MLTNAFKTKLKSVVVFFFSLRELAMIPCSEVMLICKKEQMLELHVQYKYLAKNSITNVH